MNDSQRTKRVEKAQMKVLFSVPFFAPGVAKLPVVWDDQIDTACTDGKEIRWSRKFFDSLDDQCLVTVLCHEVCHCLLGHLWRAPVGADHGDWNQACDHAVNLQLEEFSQLVTAKRLAEPFPFPKDFPALKNPGFKNMAEEVIYGILNHAKPPGSPQGVPGGIQAGSGPSNGQGGGKGKQGGGKSGQVPSSGNTKKAGVGDFQIIGISAPGSKKSKTEWDHTLIQSCTMAKGRGDLPAGMARVLGDFLNPKVEWYELLRQWLREQCTDDWNWQKPNRMFGDCEFILPVLESEKIGPVVFATDTSGSIDHDQLARFQGEKQSALDDLRPSRLLDIYCDSAIHKVAEYQVGETISKEAPGGGGTNFGPVFEYVGKLPVQPKCLVYLTDLDGSFPSADPGYPVLWICWEQGKKAPFGEVVFVGEAS